MCICYFQDSCSSTTQVGLLFSESDSYNYDAVAYILFVCVVILHMLSMQLINSKAS